MNSLKEIKTQKSVSIVQTDIKKPSLNHQTTQKVNASQVNTYVNNQISKKGGVKSKIFI